ncbi:MAG TPA: 2-C-methyl-D-erythritol 4-phosphate cytidylyltransferase [Candidatus Stackebrandtia faecavium]|nr:2-C-methyl-D-erythritol 4-phosphate cytidylyltransferase [Candidatus Stackebrandtia faecavium]
MTKTVAAVLAGGTGTRLGAQLPKQLLTLDGKEILAHSLDAFEACAAVDEVFVFMTAGYVDAAKEITKRYGYRKVVSVSVGGASRDASTRAALAALGEYGSDTRVLIHDAVRPLIRPQTIAACAEALQKFDAATVAVESTDTVVSVEETADGQVIDAIPDRAKLRRCQTPQAFRLGVLSRAHHLALADPGFTPTDDCGVVRKYLPHLPIGLVPGDEHNLKITRFEDLKLAQWLLHQKDLNNDESSAAPPSGHSRPEWTRGGRVRRCGGSYDPMARLRSRCHHLRLRAVSLRARRPRAISGGPRPSAGCAAAGSSQDTTGWHRAGWSRRHVVVRDHRFRAAAAGRVVDTGAADREPAATSRRTLAQPAQRLCGRIGHVRGRMAHGRHAGHGLAGGGRLRARGLRGGFRHCRFLARAAPASACRRRRGVRCRQCARSEVRDPFRGPERLRIPVADVARLFRCPRRSVRDHPARRRIPAEDCGSHGHADCGGTVDHAARVVADRQHQSGLLRQQQHAEHAVRAFRGADTHPAHARRQR